MKKTIVLSSVGLSAVAVILTGLAAACTQNSPAPNHQASTVNRANTTTAAPANAAAASNTTDNSHAAKTDETPALVKAVFTDAQSFTVQHKDVPGAATASIEKDAGVPIPNRDHHSYLAFTNAGGTRKQIGAATIVKANGKDVVIVYENKNGSPYIKEVRAEGVPAAFLRQFAGKGHDDSILVGADLKANGADEATAKAIADQVRVDAMTMQSLYGAAHSH